MNDSVELRKVVNVGIRYWWLLLIATIAGALIGLLISRWQTPVFSASTMLLVGQSIQSTDFESRDMAISQQMTQTYARLARLQPVMQAAVERSDIDMTWRVLAQRVRATPVEGTQLLKISVEATSPDEAFVLANSIAEAVILLSPATVQGASPDEDQRFVSERLEFLRINVIRGQQRVEELEARLLTANSVQHAQEIQTEIDATQTLIIGWEGNYSRMSAAIRRPGSPNSLMVVESAQGSSNPVRPRTKLNMLVLALAGFALTLGIIVFREIVGSSGYQRVDID